MKTPAQRITETGIIPVVKLLHPQEDAVPLARALIEGDISVMEITFRAAGATKAIRLITENCPEMLVGAGTILNVDQIDEAYAAGARFFVTPGFDSELITHCLSRGLTIFPGCTTASEYHSAYRLGLPILKFFPAEQSGGLAKIKALNGPFPMFQVIPTGGITLDNLGEYLASPIICACGGSYMVPQRAKYSAILWRGCFKYCSRREPDWNLFLREGRIPTGKYLRL